MFEAGDQVVCVDGKTQQSFAGFPQDDFTFPNGFVVEGGHYLVLRARPGSGGTQILEIEGFPVLLWTGDVHGWHSHRFRKIEADSLEQAEDASVEEDRVVAVPASGN